MRTPVAARFTVAVEVSTSDQHSEYMTRAAVKQYVTAWNGEIIMGVLAGVLGGVGVITSIGDLADLGVAATLTLDNLLGWALFLVAGILFFFAMLQNRRKRIALE